VAVVGSITAADKAFVETWENIATPSNGIVRLDARGIERIEMIAGRRQFMCTSEERKITQDRVVDERYDPFRNGAFRPVIVPDSVDKNSNPNALSDDEISSILISSELAWGEWMAVIDSPETLRRMSDIAEQSDVSLKRYRQVEARLLEVKPKTRITQKDREQYESMGGPGGTSDGRPSAPRSDPRPGGRSADYRREG
jgi:hypothetical protein